MKINLHRPRALLAWLAAGVLAAGLVALVGASPAWAALGFASPSNSPFAVGAAPTTVTSADFDKDGNTDLATSNYASDGVSILLGDGAGGFEEVTGGPVSAGGAPTSVTSADLNGDAKADLAVSNESSNNVSVLLGNGDGTFLGKPDLAAGTSPTSVASADFNGDGDADLAVSNAASNNVSVLLGNGDGTFGAAQNFLAGDLPAFVISPDLNADRVADLAVANQISNNVSVLLNTTPPPPPEPFPPVSTHALSPQPNTNGWNNANVTVTLNATDTGGSGLKEIRYSATGAQTIAETVYNPQNQPVISTQGITTISYYAVDNAGNPETPEKTFTVKLDKSAPTVVSFAPVGKKPTGMGWERGTNITAEFSDEMNQSTLTAQTIKLVNTATGRRVSNVVVSYNEATKTLTLDPPTLLAANKKYKVTVTTGAKNLAGLSLDQNPGTSGNQPKSWTFITGST